MFVRARGEQDCWRLTLFADHPPTFYSYIELPHRNRCGLVTMYGTKSSFTSRRHTNNVISRLHVVWCVWLLWAICSRSQLLEILYVNSLYSHAITSCLWNIQVMHINNLPVTEILWHIEYVTRWWTYESGIQSKTLKSTRCSKVEDRISGFELEQKKLWI